MLMLINVIGSISFGVGAAPSASPVAVDRENVVLRSIKVIGARMSLVSWSVEASLGCMINVVGARPSPDVAVTLVSVVVVLGIAPSSVGMALMVTIKVVVTVMVAVSGPCDQDFVPQCASRL